jgi:hypothetical protein
MARQWNTAAKNRLFYFFMDRHFRRLKAADKLLAYFYFIFVFRVLGRLASGGNMFLYCF